MLKPVMRLWKTVRNQSLLGLAGASILATSIGCQSTNPGWQVHRLHGNDQQNATYASSQVPRPAHPAAFPQQPTTAQLSYIWLNGQWVPMHTGVAPPVAPPPGTVVPQSRAWAGNGPPAMQQASAQPQVPPAPGTDIATKSSVNDSPTVADQDRLQTLQTQIEQSRLQLEALTKQLQEMRIQSVASKPSLLPEAPTALPAQRPVSLPAKSADRVALTRFTPEAVVDRALTIPAIESRPIHSTPSADPNTGGSSLDVLERELQMLKGQTRQAMSAQRAVHERASGNRDAQVSRLRDIVAKLAERLDARENATAAADDGLIKGDNTSKTEVARKSASTTDSAPSGVDALTSGRAAFRSSDYSLALGHFTRAEETLADPKQRAMAQYMSATCLRKLDRPEAAIRKYESLIDSQADPTLGKYADWQVKTIKWKTDLNTKSRQFAELPAKN